MPRIKIEDLPVLEDLGTKEIKGIFGGEVIPKLVAGEELLKGTVKVNYKITPEFMSIAEIRSSGQDGIAEFDEKDVEEGPIRE